MSELNPMTAYTETASQTYQRQENTRHLAELDAGPARITRRDRQVEQETEAYWYGIFAADLAINQYNPATQPRLFEAWGAGNRDK